MDLQLRQAGDCDEVFSYPMFRDLEKRDRRRSAGSPATCRSTSTSPCPGRRRSMPTGSWYRDPTSRCSAFSRRSGACFDRTDDQPIERELRDGAQLRLLGERLGGEPGGARQTDHGEWPALTIIGVAPRGFSGTTLGARPDVFVPISMAGLMIDGGRASKPIATSILIYHLRPPRAGRHDGAGAPRRSTPRITRSSTTSRRRGSKA